jgi:hypothetical protein
VDLQRIPPERRHPADYRDEIEHAEVARILSGLPENHPARIAYAAGAREAADSISLTHLVADHRDLVGALVEANLAAYWRTRDRQGGHFRP